MNNITLYPELIDYIYYYCNKFQTNDEILAGRTILYAEGNLTEPLKKFVIRKGWYSDAWHIRQMIGNGFEDFKNNVAIRIFKEHRDELDLNLCPACLKITRTPQAKQCRFCFHNWH